MVLVKTHLRMDPRPAFLADIDPSKSRFISPTSPIVLLCGGPVELKTSPEADDPPVRSLRHALTKANLAAVESNFELFRPEEIQSWHQDGTYKNLVDFECDLASICALVVIIVESYGAVAELGTFSQVSHLKHKIVTVLSERYSNDVSFINLGIIRLLTRENENCVKTFPWEITHPGGINAEIVNDLRDDILDELEKQAKQQQFSIENDVHLMGLIYELINMFVALKETEIQDYIAQLGRPLTTYDIRRRLYLLQEFKIIRKIKYSDAPFYANTKEEFSRIYFGSKSGARLDQLRIRTDAIAFYRDNSKERNRFRALSAARIGS